MQLRDTTILEVFKVSEVNHVANVAAGGMELMEKMQIHQPTWYFIYLILLIGLFAWIRLYYGNMVIQTLQASTNFQVAVRMFNDSGLLKNQLDLILYFFYLLSMAFLLYYLELKTDLRPYDLHGGLLCLFNFAVLAGIFLFRALLVNLTGILFHRQKIIREYLYNIFIYNKLSGMVVLPLVFLLVYTTGTMQQLIFWVTIFVLSAIVVMRIVRGVVFSYRKEVLLFYLFLYLCALEIAPLVLLYRWLEGIL
jgi:hypothetical protein